jgi:hypothetical protein
MSTYAYCPQTAEDLDIMRRMDPATRASYALGEVGDHITTRVEAKRVRRDDLGIACRATVGLPDEVRSSVFSWVMARANARTAAADLAKAEEAIL